MNLLDYLYQSLNDKRGEINFWLESERESRKLPIYASVDIRDAGWKAAVVDANFFPSGFNNVSSQGIVSLALELRKYLDIYHEDVRHIHIYPESHTRNQWYVENLLTIYKILIDIGVHVTIGSPQLNGYSLLEGLSSDLSIEDVKITADDSLIVEDVLPDLILLNHDLTGGLLGGLNSIVEPPINVGWQQRRKSDHYRNLMPLISDLASIMDVDEWLFSPMWTVCEDNCLEFEECRIILAAQINNMIDGLGEKYAEYGIEADPVIYVKNDRGTYGLGILAINKGEQILNLSRRSMKKLTYGKGGNNAENFLIQEGIPTSLKMDGAPMEPVGYTIGGAISSWFYRVNHDRDEMGNLNSPAARFIDDTKLSPNLVKRMDKSSELYNLIASLSYLAMADEAEASLG